MFTENEVVIFLTWKEKEKKNLSNACSGADAKALYETRRRRLFPWNKRDLHLNSWEDC